MANPLREVSDRITVAVRRSYREGVCGEEEWTEDLWADVRALESAVAAALEERDREIEALRAEVRKQVFVSRVVYDREVVERAQKGTEYERRRTDEREHEVP